MGETNFIETNILLAFMNENDDEAEKLISGLYTSELVSLRVFVMRMHRFIGMELDARLSNPAHVEFIKDAHKES